MARNSNNTRRRGFGLIDLVIGAICVSLLASLAMPCLLQLRGQSRSEECKNRLRQICLAAHNYHSARRKFPAATLGYPNAVDSEEWSEQKDSDVYWKHGQNTSSLFLIAPYMELNELYNKVAPVAMDPAMTLKEYNEKTEGEEHDYAWQGDILGMDDVMQEVIDDFLCPEDDLNEHGLKAVIATQPCQPFEAIEMDSIDACRDIAVQYWTEEEMTLGLTNYVGCLGAAGISWDPDNAASQWRGIMSPREACRMRDVTDGTSNTLLYGESLGGINDGDRSAGMSWSWGGAARIVGLWPLDATEHPDDDSIPMIGNEKYCSSVGFGSRHDGVSMFAFADGSVQEIRSTVDREVLYKLAGRADGNIVHGF